MKYLIQLFFLVSLTSCFGKQSENLQPEGSILPEFNILLADSTTYLNTNNIPKGKPFVLFFFGPHCPYSRAQMKEITTNIELLKNTSVYAITPFSYIDMKQFYDAYYLNNYKSIHTGIDYKNFIAPYFQVKGVPYLLIYDENKKLKKALNGTTSVKEILSYL